jgi:hypothetical protein
LTSNPPTSDRPAILIGASIPRSGHHFLARVLRRYYGSQLHYCEFYHPENCCRAVPCSRRIGQRITYQKNHDHDFSLATDVPGAIYVIQHRRPVPEALSDRELYVRNREERGLPAAESIEQHIRWLANKIAYYKGFHDKWIVAPPARAIRIDYDDLSRDPLAEIGRFVAMVDAPPDEERLAWAVNKIRHRRGKGTPYKPRVIEQSAAFDRDLYAAFESIVLDLCPAFGYQPMLDRVSYAGHPLYRAYLGQAEGPSEVPSRGRVGVLLRRLGIG